MISTVYCIPYKVIRSTSWTQQTYCPSWSTGQAQRVAWRGSFSLFKYFSLPGLGPELLLLFCHCFSLQVSIPSHLLVSIIFAWMAHQLHILFFLFSLVLYFHCSHFLKVANFFYKVATMCWANCLRPSENFLQKQHVIILWKGTLDTKFQ